LAERGEGEGSFGEGSAGKGKEILADPEPERLKKIDARSRTIGPGPNKTHGRGAGFKDSLSLGTHGQPRPTSFGETRGPVWGKSIRTILLRVPSKEGVKGIGVRIINAAREEGTSARREGSGRKQERAKEGA